MIRRWKSAVTRARISPSASANAGRAGREVDVSVADYAWQCHGHAFGVDVWGAGGESARLGRVGAVEEQPPGQQRHDRIDRGLGWASRPEVAQHRNAHRAGVEAVGVRADHGDLGKVAARPGPPEPVDEKVVADVIPAVGVDVVGLDRPDHRRHVLSAVAVGVHRVVEYRQPCSDGCVVATERGRAAAPVLPRVDLRGAAGDGNRGFGAIDRRVTIRGAGVVVGPTEVGLDAPIAGLGQCHRVERRNIEVRLIELDSGRGRRRFPTGADQMHLDGGDRTGHREFEAVGDADPDRVGDRPSTEGRRGGTILGSEFLPGPPARRAMHPYLCGRLRPCGQPGCPDQREWGRPLAADLKPRGGCGAARRCENLDIDGLGDHRQVRRSARRLKAANGDGQSQALLVGQRPCRRSQHCQDGEDGGRGP